MTLKGLYWNFSPVRPLMVATRYVSDQRCRFRARLWGCIRPANTVTNDRRITTN